MVKGIFASKKDFNLFYTDLVYLYTTEVIS